MQRLRAKCRVWSRNDRIDAGLVTRWLATRSLLSILVMSVLAALLLYFLFNTLRSRDVLLNQIVERLPEGDELTWSRAEGPASGPMTLHDLRYVHRACPDREMQSRG